MLGAAEGNDPRNCVRFQTLAFTEQVTKERGAAAIRACEKAAREPELGDVSTSSYEIRAESGAARVRMSYKGEYFDGQTLEFALVEEGDRWKFDRLVRFVRVNRAKLIAELGANTLREAPSRFGARFTACLVDRLEELGDGQLENLMLGPTWRPLEDIAESCVPGESPAQSV